MILSVKSVLLFFIAAILSIPVLSQVNSAGELYRDGKLLIKKNPSKAFYLLEAAMKSSRNSKDWKLYMKSLNSLASFTLENDEKREMVFQWLKSSFPLLKSSEENDDVAQLHFYTAEYYNRITVEIDSPIFHYQQAKRIWTSLKGELSAEVSNCYHGLGNIYKYNKFDFYEAERCYEQALLIREKIGFDDSLRLYRNYYSLAATNRSQHDFQKAISYGDKTLELATKLGPDRVELASGMIANIYRDMGESGLAKKYYLQALALNEKTKDLESRAWYYVCLGETFMKDNLFYEAQQYFRKAYALYSKPEVKDQSVFIRLLIIMLESYSMTNDQQNFIKVRKEIFNELDLLNKIPNSREAAEVWLLIGMHHDRRQSYDSALYFYQKSLIASVPSFKDENVFRNPTEEQIGSKYYVNELLAKKSSALRSKFSSTKETDYLDYAITCLRLAEKLLSKQRNTLDMEAAKWEFLDANYDLYEAIVATLSEGKGQLPADTVNDLAFQYFEQSKARSLTDALILSELSNQISSKDSLLRLHNELKRQLFSVQDAIENAQDKNKVASLRQEMVKLDQQIHLCKLSIEEKFPGYFNAKYRYRPVPVDAVQQMVKKNNQVLLEYFWGSRSIYGIGINGDQIIFQELGSSDSLHAKINKVLMHLRETRSNTDPSQFRSFTSNSHELYNILIRPFSSLFSSNRRLQIIPDGAINQIPFEILLEEEVTSNQVNYRSLKYLLKSFSIGYAYSSAMVLHKTVQRRIPKPSLLAVGLTGSESLRYSDQDLEVIKGAEKELKTLEKLFADGKFLVDKEATESNFKLLAPNFDIIHLAIHGRGDLNKNFAASLHFTSSPGDSDDGELHAYELYGLKLKALIAVLSSCESGLGKGYRGEGMISMASSFTYSGCENTLMSLWKVNDQASIKLMDDFYSNIYAGETIDDALRMSKLNYLASADELTADPRIWAPLIVYGSLEEVFQTGKNRIFMISVAVIFVIAVLILSRYVYKKRLRT